MQPKEPTFDHPNRDSFEREETAESPALARRRQLLGGQHSSGDFAPHGGDEPRQRTLLPEAELGSAAREPDPDIPPLPAGTAPRSAGLAPRGVPGAVHGRPRRGRLYLGGAVAVIVVALGWWLFPRGAETGNGGEAPLVVAEQGPEKVRPQEEGGMPVPNQGISIYNELAGTQTPAKPEVLLPEPEVPITPPAAAVPTEPATAGPAAAGETSAPPVVPAPPEAPAEADMTPAAGAQATEATAATQPAPPPQQAEQAPPSAPAAAAETPPSPPATIAQPAKPPTQTAAAGGAFRVQLAAVKSADAAKAAWAKMTKANPDALKGLSLKVVKVDRGSDGPLYRVQGGPLSDRAAADSVCSRLKQTGQACMVVAP